MARYLALFFSVVAPIASFNAMNMQGPKPGGELTATAYVGLARSSSASRQLLMLQNMIKAPAQLAGQRKPSQALMALRFIQTQAPMLLNQALHFKYFGKSALHYAAANGYTKLAEALIAAGAPPGLLDDSGNTALALAEKSRRQEMVELLK